MRILFCNLFKALTADTICATLRKMQHRVTEKTYYTPENLYQDDRLYSAISKDLKTTYDVVISVNFWPILARACHKAGVPYISWGYDSPQNLPLCEDMDYDTNYIFTFDKLEVASYQKKGISRVFHAPLATDTSRWDTIQKDASVSFDISFVGQVYESTYPMLAAAMQDYTGGFCHAIISAQQKVYGYYMISELLTDEIIEKINADFAANEKAAWGSVTKDQLSYSLGSYVTYLDRLTLLRFLQNAGEVHLFSDPPKEETQQLLDGVKLHERVSYEKGMPHVFKSSKINMNPILRVIQSGIPQRALDIMGCGAFMLSSYQPELAEYFAPDEEVVLYDSYEDALAKADFYLRHDSLREQIARAGYERVKNEFTYETSLRSMLGAIEL